MTRHVTLPIDDATNMKLRLYGALLGSTKTEAGSKAMRDGIPAWVMAISPTEATALGRKTAIDNTDPDDLESILDDAPLPTARAAQ